MKTFENLEFKNHELCSLGMFRNHKQAEMSFNNGYTISVLLGDSFWSNGVDTYELALFYKGSLCGENNIIKENPKGYLTDLQVNEIICKIQNK